MYYDAPGNAVPASLVTAFLLVYRFLQVFFFAPSSQTLSFYVLLLEEVTDLYIYIKKPVNQFRPRIVSSVYVTHYISLFSPPLPPTS